MRHWTSVWGSNNWRFSWTNFLFYMKVFTCDLCRGTRAYCTSCSVCLYICMHLRFCLSVCVCVCMCDTYAHINLHVSAWWLMWQSGYNLYYIVLPFYKGRGGECGVVVLIRTVLSSLARKLGSEVTSEWRWTQAMTLSGADCLGGCLMSAYYDLFLFVDWL